MRIEPLEHSEPATAVRIAALQREAYEAEARLLGVTDFPPARTTASGVASSGARYLGVTVDGELVGAIATEPHDSGGVLIASLTVAPAHHRRGIGRALVARVVADTAERPLVVSTGAANAPAIALYRGFGFVEGARRLAGAERIPVVELRLERAAS